MSTNDKEQFSDVLILKEFTLKIQNIDSQSQFRPLRRFEVSRLAK